MRSSCEVTLYIYSFIVGIVSLCERETRPEVRAKTAILKLRLRATLEFAILSRPCCALNHWTFPTDRDTTPARRYISYRHRDRPTAVPQPHCTCVPFTQRRMQQRPKCARAPTRSSPSATEPRHAALAKPGRVCHAVRASELRPTPRAARFTTGQATTPGK